MGKGELFDCGPCHGRWMSFCAEGYGNEVVGVVYDAVQAEGGVPLGGIATGHVHLNTDGTFGWCTLFDSVIPPRNLGGLPLAGVAVGDRAWILSTKETTGVESVKGIRYWGHYPVADVVFDLDCPVSVSLRAWSPFLPGSAVDSNTPAIFFEFTLNNLSTARQAGSIAVTFPGASDEETGGVPVFRKQVNGEGIAGVTVETEENVGFFLGATGVGDVRTGGDLNRRETSWAEIKAGLPSLEGLGASVAVDFDLEPDQSTTLRFVLTWYKPTLVVNGRHKYVHAYAPRFEDAADVAVKIAREHESLLRRIIAWQEVIYSEDALPDWLRDCLVNNFHMIAKDAFWEANSVPPEDWAREHGMFSMVESIRTWPGQACIPSDWMGNLQIVYFFPELALSTLRGFAHYQLPNGETPIYFGQNYERQNPVYQFLHLTSPCNYVDLVGRLWRRTDSDAVLREFYPSVKKAVEYLRGLDTDADGLLECPVGALSHQFYGAWEWRGTATHVAGMWLSVLEIAERMADKIGDTSFVRDCQVWQKLGRQSLESKLWNNVCYLLYNDADTGRTDDTILGGQLAGLWSCRLHGVDDVFPAERVKETLETVKKVCFPAAKYGSATARRPDGSVNLDGKHQSTDIFLGECLVLAATMIYAGEMKTGLEIARQLMEAIVIRNGRAWDMPGFLNNDTGEPSYGNDFDQMMAVWSLPSAIAGQTLGEFVSRGGLVDRIITAATS